MAQNEMRAMRGMPLRVRSSEWLATLVPWPIKTADHRNLYGVRGQDSRRRILTKAFREIHTFKYSVISTNESFNFSPTWACASI